MTVGTRDRRVNTTGLRRGRDGKLYSARPLTPEERSRARWLAHRDHLSIRAAQQVMAQTHDRSGDRS